MKPNENELCIQLIRKEITILLEQFQFFQIDKDWWVRKKGWKSDVIYIAQKNGVLINLCVWIPPENDPSSNLDHEEIDMINLGTYVGLKSQEYTFPLWRSSRSICRKVVQDLRKGMKWFDQFSTPQLCLEYIKEKTWNPSSPGALYRQKYLSSLPSEVAQTGKITKLKHKYPNEFSRALFDLDYKGQLPKTEDDEENDI